VVEIKYRTNIGTLLHGGTYGSVLYVDVNKKIAQDNANFFWKDSGGFLGLGNSNPSVRLHATIETPGTVPEVGTGVLAIFQRNDTTGRTAGINILAGTAGVAEINFGDADDEDAGRIQYSNTNNELRFRTATATRMTIDNTGDTGIGTETPGARLDVFGDTRLGDSTANYVEVESDGDVNFTGGAGLQFGEIWYMNVTGFDTDLAAQDTWYQLLGFDTNGVSNGSVTPDHTNDHITVGKTGKYKIEFHVSSRSAAANIYHFMVRANNGSTDINNIMAHRVTSVAGRIEAASSGGYASLSANDTVELWVQRKDGGAVTKTITTEHVTLSLKQVAG
jgi:hypothetical protein